MNTTPSVAATPATVSQVPPVPAAGVPVTINSDDPPMFGTTLEEEYAVAARLLGLDTAGVAGLARAAVVAPVERQEVRRGSGQARGHMNNVRIHREMHQRALLEGEQQIALVAFATALTTGRFPISELEKFAEGKPSTGTIISAVLCTSPCRSDCLISRSIIPL